MPESEDTPSELEDNLSEAAYEDGDHVDAVRAQWAAVRPDLDTSPVSVIARLGRATAFVDAGINARLADFGLTREAWDVLASLRRAGPPFRLSPTQLYVGLMRSSGAMTHRLAGLERAGLVKRVPDLQDGRSVLVQLTRRGLRVVERVAPEHLANERVLLSALTEDELKTLAGLLRKLLRSYEAERLAPPTSGPGGRRKTQRNPRQLA
jgi:DNA-binding MarR family transcriptional regulator